MNWRRIVGLTLIAALGGGLVAASATASAQPSTPIQPAQDHAHNAHNNRPHGDRNVRRALVAATAQVTRQRPARVRQQIEAGQSIAQIAQQAGKRPEEVLARFDTMVGKQMERAVNSGRLPESLADSRAAWFKQSARLQLDQPGLRPVFPGLHELHVVVIRAAVRASEIPRATIRDQLKSCKTPAEVVGTKGKTSGDIVGLAMARLDRELQAAVAAKRLTVAQHDTWRAALVDAVTKMTTTAGLHVAGKECAR